MLSERKEKKMLKVRVNDGSGNALLHFGMSLCLFTRCEPQYEEGMNVW